jgi:hypothetical protein
MAIDIVCIAVYAHRIARGQAPVNLTQMLANRLLLVLTDDDKPPD